MSKFGCTLLLSLTVLVAAGQTLVQGPALAQRPSLSGEERAFFENKIRPVLVKHCYECHSAGVEDIGGNLLLDSRDGLLRGGHSGPALVAGDAETSLILQALRYEHLEMPPQDPLPEAIVNDFATWIRRGAADPRIEQPVEQATAAVDEEALWSFLPLRSPAVPAVKNTDWPAGSVDRFVLARLEAAGLEPTADAPAATLVRRLYYDLLGLPPTADDVDAFVRAYQADADAAVAQWVDALLQQPQFGERWGRHWLDVARYGESNGDDGLGRNATFPHAWRYRDYVIDAFNRDVPYDRFLQEQIAGDLLPAESAQQRNRQLVATGFLAIGSKPAHAMNANFAMDVVDDQINAVCTAVMGLSVACARCHDHKHDPIPTRDYYALAGIFSSTETLYGLAGNEPLTAPPTALHTLSSLWQPAGSPPNDSASGSVSNAAPEFPATYAAAIDQLKPFLHAPLDVACEALHTDPVLSYSPQNYAEVQSANITGRFPQGSADESQGSANYSVAFWFRNQTANQQQPITAYLFSRAKLGDSTLPGDHLGIAGTHDANITGKLFVFNGNDNKELVAGSSVVAPGTWNHVVLIRDGGQVRVYLNGNLEIDDALPATFGDSPEFCLANRSDRFAPLVGNLARLAIFDRALSDDEADTLHAASGQPRGVRTLGLAMGIREKAKAANSKIHIGGETSKQGDEVPRGFLTAYAHVASETELQTAAADVNIGDDQSGRLQLAAWLTDPQHPQTARVMVNRVWLHLFGQGIVSTPDDFGVYGARPTHPQLLDYLAEQTIREGWSTKALIRKLVLSRTYRLDSLGDEALTKLDPDNRLLGRHTRRRLDAESLRDSMLVASGQIDLRAASGSVIAKTDALINWPPGEASNLHQDSRHRSVYLCLLRHSPPPELVAFDLPSGVEVVGRRSETTLPTQALYLLNNRFVLAQAAALANDLLAAPQSQDAERVRMLFRRVLQRDPQTAELERTLAHLESLSDALAETDSDLEQHRLQAWISLSQALFATNEFRYID